MDQSSPDSDDTPDATQNSGDTIATHTQKIPGRLLRLSIETSLVRPRIRRRPAREVLVYLPESYDDPSHATQRFDVIYLLHGSPGFPSDFVSHGDWPEIEEKAGHAGGHRAAIMVMPDGNYSGEKHGDSEWANSADGRDRFEDFVVDDIVPWVDQRFRTVAAPSGRLIAGVSEGGYGSVNIALHHPELFGFVIALSGYYDNGGFGWARKIMGYSDAYLHANSPLTYTATVSAGDHSADQWRTVQFFLGAGSDEERYTDETRRMADRLTSLGVPATLSLLKGKHGWELWDQLFAQGIAQMLQGVDS